MNFLKRLFTKKPKCYIFTTRVSKDNCDRILDGYIIERSLMLNGKRTNHSVFISIEE